MKNKNGAREGTVVRDLQLMCPSSIVKRVPLMQSQKKKTTIILGVAWERDRQAGRQKTGGPKQVIRMEGRRGTSYLKQRGQCVMDFKWRT